FVACPALQRSRRRIRSHCRAYARGSGRVPTLVVLGLDDEHSEPRNEDVINLGCAVLQLEGDVIHQVIVRKTEVRLHDVGQQRLATILVCGGTGGTVAANDEANGKCKEDVESGPVVLGPVKEKLR